MKFSDLQFTQPTVELGSRQAIIDLPEGFRLSIVQGPLTYGGEEGLWEIGLIQPNGNLAFVHQWHDQVKGFLTEAQVEAQFMLLTEVLQSDPTKLIE